MNARAYLFKDLLVTVIDVTRKAKPDVCCDVSICHQTTLCKPVTDKLTAGELDDAEALFGEALKQVKKVKLARTRAGKDGDDGEDGD